MLGGLVHAWVRPGFAGSQRWDEAHSFLPYVSMPLHWVGCMSSSETKANSKAAAAADLSDPLKRRESSTASPQSREHSSSLSPGETDLKSLPQCFLGSTVNPDSESSLNFRGLAAQKSHNPVETSHQEPITVLYRRCVLRNSVCFIKLYWPPLMIRLLI